MTEIKRIEAGARMSEVIVYGDRVYTAGVVADAAYGKSVYEQTKDILGQIDTMLEGVGSDKTRILKANIWLADITTFDEMNKAWDAWVIAGKTPVRATVESHLADSGYKVEIMIEAVI